MKYCESCGASLVEGSAFCAGCGAPVTADKGKVVDPKVQATPQLTLEPLVARNYWLWFLLSWVLGLIGLFYLYLNFDDLNRLDRYPRPNEVPSPKVEMNNLIILVVISIVCGLAPFIMPYITYLKFQKFYDYLEVYPKKTAKKIISGRKFIKLVLISVGASLLGLIFIALGQTVFWSMGDFLPIFSVIFGAFIVFIASTALSIYMIIQNANWQEAYNELAYIICPDTIKKDLF